MAGRSGRSTSHYLEPDYPGCGRREQCPADQGRNPGPKGGVVLVRTAVKGSLILMAVKTLKVDLPAEIFDAQASVPLLHQVVVAQLAAATGHPQDQESRRGFRCRP